MTDAAAIRGERLRPAVVRNHREARRFAVATVRLGAFPAQATPASSR